MLLLLLLQGPFHHKGSFESGAFICDVLSGKIPMLPRAMCPFVDVR